MSNLLHLDTVAHFLMESIEFEIPELMNEATQLLICYFDDVFEAAPDFLYYIPNERLVEILSHD